MEGVLESSHSWLIDDWNGTVAVYAYAPKWRHRDGIALPSKASVAIHEEAAFKLGRWVDIGDWPLLL